MATIRVLPPHVADLIAAGEVVDRPASIVKELCENALDAGAASITVETGASPAAFLRVTDDGRGMESSDVPLCILRHATSKIRTAEDLYAIASLGFRGEALAAISAVSDLTVITCKKGEPMGTHARFTGGELLNIAPAGAPQGTTMVVRDVFRNTPARLKFLKRDGVELSAVSDVVERLALSRPDVAFRLLKEGEILLSTPGSGDLAQTVYALFGKEVHRSLVPVAYQYESIRVEGFVSRPEQSRPNRSMQYVFLNQRSVKAQTVGYALEEAYRDRIMTRRYPACFLNLSLRPELCDVNVHPSKLEVKFSREKEVYDGVYFAVKSALLADPDLPDATRGIMAPKKEPSLVQTPLGDTAAALPQSVRRTQTDPEVTELLEKQLRCAMEQNQQAIEQERARNPKPDFSPLYFDQRPLVPVEEAPLPGDADAPVQCAVPPRKSSTSLPAIEQPADQQEAAVLSQNAEQAKEAFPQPPTAQPLPAFRVIGECFNTYILVERGEELLLIDKHAAHERILYEQLLRRGRISPSQLLLEPLVFEFPRAQTAALLEQTDLFTEMGFLVEPFGENALLVREVPAEFAAGDLRALLGEMADQLCAGVHQVRSELQHRLYATVACKAAIKAGKPSAAVELSSLVAALFCAPDIKYCPHGRPVMVAMSRTGLEKEFRRIL